MNDVSYRLIFKRLAGQWRLTESDYRCLLALGSGALDDLLKIDTTLKQLFASSPLLAELWMSSPNKAFAGQTPMELIKREGMAGLRRVVEFVSLERE